jgi:hypothetical protein
MTMRRQPTVTSAHTSGSWLRFLGAIAALLVVAVGIPVGLVVVCRAGLGPSQPLPGLGSWKEIRSWATTQRSSNEVAHVALRVLISLCWVLWAALVLSLLASIAGSRPSLERVRIPRLRMFEGFGAWIVAGLTAIASLTPNIAHATPGPRRAPVVAAARPVVRFASGRAGWSVVQPAESIEMFAARTLGTADRWPEIWDLNQGRTMDDTGTTWSQPWRVTAGWELELPAVTSGAAPLSDTPLHLVAADTDACDTVVEPG